MQLLTQNQQHTLSGAAVTGWDSTRKIGEPGDTCSWEKREATVGHDPDSLWTDQRVGLYGKPARSLLGVAGGTQGDFLKRRSQPLCRGLTCTGTSRVHWLGQQRGRSGNNLPPLRVPHRLIKGGPAGAGSSPQKDLFNRGTELPCRDLWHSS